MDLELFPKFLDCFSNYSEQFSVLIFVSPKDGLYRVIPVGGRKKPGEEKKSMEIKYSTCFAVQPNLIQIRFLKLSH